MEPKKRGRPPTKHTSRPVRISMSGSSLRMHIPEEYRDPDFHYGWQSDKGDIVARSKRAGYEHVTHAEMPQWGQLGVDSADPTSSVISMNVGGGITAYMMKQPMEFYSQDQEAKNALVDARESGMKQQLNSGQDGTYGDVKIE